MMAYERSKSALDKFRKCIHQLQHETKMIIITQSRCTCYGPIFWSNKKKNVTFFKTSDHLNVCEQITEVKRNN